ncbi:hypothetical protein FA13DRAFT_1727949 [Coprinellus micaceus]|uniref:Nucleoporin Nup133/Nup155-like C-terminal domain-containing protein n=1 Tax=Coprinellus micaceus TaxID=71717 RepID=A0A4Y7TS40_COPMI|nr:hypothetical protein FA13DRAFT_1727949 [Coprinellus micaceus]
MGGIDTLSGFAVIASSRTCFVWQHAQKMTFSIPPFHALVPHGASQEPGLILLSHSGHVRFWQSIGMGLAGGENFAPFDLNLREGESVTNLTRVDNQLYVASTSHGSLYRIALSSTGGKYHLATRLFSRPPSARGLFSFLGSSSTQSPIGEREVWALGEERIQKWILKAEGWEEKVVDENLSEAVKMVLEDSQTVSEGEMDLELLDLAINEAGSFIVLVSYAGKEESGNLRRLYALVQLELVGKTFTVLHVKPVPYQNTSAPTAPVVPRIQLLLSGAIVSVEFGDTVAFCSEESEYQDRIQLKSQADRTLGVGVHQGNNSLLVLTASSMMQVQLSLDKIRRFSPQTGRTNLIKSTMMQAILYGSLPENPLYFSFPPHVDEESLMRGAEQLSQAVLRSDPEVVRRDHDLTAQLHSRSDRLSWLMSFIGENMVQDKMSQRSKQRLATDAEKLHAAESLWQAYNELLETSPKFTVLNDCVHAYMAELGELKHEDVMRAFFRTRVAELGRLIRKVAEVIKMSAEQTKRDVYQLLPEANQIVIVTLHAAFKYRSANHSRYYLEAPMISAWTSRPGTIDIVLSLFDLTTKAFDAAAAGSISLTETALHDQLPQLAALLFECVSERLQWLSSPIAADEPNVGQEREELEQRFASLRPEVLETLRRMGRQDKAFALAERYSDFASLVALCHRDTIWPPERNPHFERIQVYIDNYKESFTDELYQWYIQHGELRIMFDQETEHDQSAFIDRFFAKKPNPGISWLHSVGKERYEEAAGALLEEAKRARELQAKHLMLSIGKLAQLAGESADEKVLDAFHDGLDFVSVHQTLITELRSALEGVTGRRSLDNQVDIIIKAKARKLRETKGFASVYKDLVKQLLQGKALSIEDAVDLLTLKDNLLVLNDDGEYEVETVRDYATALYLLSSAHDLPEARKKSTFRTVWRRVYLNDDWAAIGKTANVSDSEIKDRLRNTALYYTLKKVIDHGIALEGNYNPAPDIASRRRIGEDYNYERDRLGDYELEEIWVRVKELVVSDEEASMWAS